MATIHLIRTTAAPEQIRDMLQAFDDFIKLAVDIEQEILAGGGRQYARGLRRSFVARRLCAGKHLGRGLDTR